MDVLRKKHAFEDLSKDELVGECQNLLTVLQEAIIANDLLQDEVQILKLIKGGSAGEIEASSIGNLNISTINMLPLDKALLIAKNNALMTELENTSKDNDGLELKTATVGFKQQQLERMIAENSLLLETRSSNLGKQNVYFNKGCVQQRQQLLHLEQTPLGQDSKADLKEMLNRSIGDMKKLKYENDNLSNQVRQLLDSISNEHLANSKFKQDLQNSHQLIYALEFHLMQTRMKLKEIKHLCQEQHSLDQVTELEVVIAQYKIEMEAKSKELESAAIIADDVNTALHKNKALVEVLESKLRNTNSKLSDNQIVSSSLTTDLENKNEKLREKNKLYYGKIIKFALEIRKLRLDKENVLTAFRHYNSNVKSWKEKLEKLAAFLSHETTKNNTAINTSQLLIEKCNSQSKTIELLNMELKGKNNELIHEYVDHGKSENWYPNEQLVLLSKQTQTELAFNVDNEVINVKRENDKLKAGIVTHKANILSLSNSLKLSDESIDVKDVSKDCIKCENADLLIERNLSNQHLTKRQSISEHKSEYEHLFKKQQNEIDNLLIIISEKNQIISSLQKLNNDFLEIGIIINDSTDVIKDCVRGDTMSISTISRAEDLGRFNDLDTSWEDRYCRLRSLALKQKVRIGELSVQLTDEQSINRNLNLKLSTSTELVITLQGQCDAFQEELDRTKAESIHYLTKLNSITEEVARDKALLATNEDTITLLRTTLERMDIDETKTALWKKQVSMKVQSLKKELEANCILKRDFQSKLTDLNAKLENKDRLLREEINRHAETKDIVQDFTNYCKKQSLVKLEMKDYERTAKQLTMQLEKPTEECNKPLKDADIQVMTGELKSLDTARNERDTLQLQVLGLQQRLTEVEDSKRLIDLDLSNLKSEYDNYKVRAQSVLRENHSRDIGLKEKLSQETESFKDCMSMMQRECEDLRYLLSEIKISNTDLKMQKLLLENKIFELQHKMEIQNEKYNVLSEQYDTATKEHSENTKILRVQSETLASYYRSKLSELESHHSQETLPIQTYVDQSNLIHSGNNTEHLPKLCARIISPPIAREAAEGSESADDIITINGTTVEFGRETSQHPLQQLLDIDSTYSDVMGLRRQLMERDSRVSHLTELLADTEQDLAKHVQMNLMLKDEIRRQQRSVEREEHAKNLEYMKNIILKFITLNNRDEKQRLVPVLNNILRLSTDETQLVYAVAKGNYRGWSTYLPAWSKPQ